MRRLPTEQLWGGVFAVSALVAVGAAAVVLVRPDAATDDIDPLSPIAIGDAAAPASDSSDDPLVTVEVADLTVTLPDGSPSSLDATGSSSTTSSTTNPSSSTSRPSTTTTGSTTTSTARPTTESTAASSSTASSTTTSSTTTSSTTASSTTSSTDATSSTVATTSTTSRPTTTSSTTSTTVPKTSTTLGTATASVSAEYDAQRRAVSVTITYPADAASPRAVRLYRNKELLAVIDWNGATSKTYRDDTVRSSTTYRYCAEAVFDDLPSPGCGNTAEVTTPRRRG